MQEYTRESQSRTDLSARRAVPASDKLCGKRVESTLTLKMNERRN